ncbi:SERAC1 protein [Thecamonas trahens ATCC 50062]|uniref:SERAC1 protein n=1 Tax=Thecamonas trahens ATCC 50062 TaxID=461836 RepID=A0A0L0DAM2_THETB|nr:SERAC1 protein [Thecamonas trahens ATCC 50062]KNC49126.1 SERAC1 protein [Thecamonas trahens ATCC 50062]|eukprot:XP_013758154.1 SERAC1 protein [Thecamonas trahens ATCC 50062]
MRFRHLVASTGRGLAGVAIAAYKLRTPLVVDDSALGRSHVTHPPPLPLLARNLRIAGALAVVELAPHGNWPPLEPALEVLAAAVPDVDARAVALDAAPLARLVDLLVAEPHRRVRELLIEVLAGLTAEPAAADELVAVGGVSALLFCARSELVPVEVFDPQRAARLLTAHAPVTADPDPRFATVADNVDAIAAALCELLLFLPTPREYSSTLADREYVSKRLASAVKTPDASPPSWWARVSGAIPRVWGGSADGAKLDATLLRLLGDYTGSPTSRSAVAAVPAPVLVSVLCELLDRADAADANSAAIQVARIVANVALDDNASAALTHTVLTSTLLPRLVQWSRAADDESDQPMELKLQAVRALSNMHRPFRIAQRPGKFVSAYDDSVYILHPTSATETLHDAEADATTATSSLDIVFVHGLRGHPVTTWRTFAPLGQPRSNIIWPHAWLPHDLEQLVARVARERGRSPMRAGHDYTSSELVKLDDKASKLWRDAGLETAFLSGMAARKARPGADHKQLRIADARILSIGYDSVWSEWSGSSLTLEERGAALLDKLVEAGVGRGGRRVVFVTHSMGGLVVKQALVLAEQRAPALLARTVGIAFYATPHFGSWLPLVASYASSVYKPSHDLQVLQMGSVQLRLLNELVRRYRHIAVMSVGEEIALPLPPERPSSPLRIVIVPPESAYPGYGRFVTVPNDHLTACKPASRSDPIYLLLLEFLEHVLRCEQATAQRARHASSQ